MAKQTTKNIKKTAIKTLLVAGIFVGVLILISSVFLNKLSVLPLSIRPITGMAVGTVGTQKSEADTSLGTAQGDSLNSLKLKVNIPCPGHAKLIIDSIQSLKGIVDVGFEFPNIFSVQYDQNQVSEKEITSLFIFNTYHAIVIG